MRASIPFLDSSTTTRFTEVIIQLGTPMLIAKLELGATNKFSDWTNAPNESGFEQWQRCFQCRLGRTLNGSSSRSRLLLSKRRRTGCSTTRRRKTESIDEKSVTEGFLLLNNLEANLNLDLQVSICKPVKIRSCQKFLPKYLSTSSQVRSH